MNSAFLRPFKSSRSGIALVGIATMLSLSSCGLFPSENKESTESSPAPSISASAEVSEESKNGDNSNSTPEETEGTDSNEEAPVEAPIEGSEPSEGEASGDIAVGVEEPGYEGGVYIVPEEESVASGTEEIPEVALETSAGEPIESAENRYLTGMKKRNDPGYSDAKLLEIGYETCEYYSESTNQTEFFDKLEQASNGDHEAEVMYVYASGASSITLCPEYEKALN